jgi:hypothetical protein
MGRQFIHHFKQAPGGLAEATEDQRRRDLSSVLSASPRCTFVLFSAFFARYHYIFPNPLLQANLQSAQVFRGDVLNPPPPPLNTNDSATTSDHLPVQIVFNHPYVQPFRITSIVRSN